MMHITIDLTDIRDKESFHDKMQEALDCPSYYGRNLDALYDVLTGYSESVELNFEGYMDFVQDLPGYGTSVQEMCVEAMLQNSKLEICFDGKPAGK